uniref:Uncharacterized protein n=1 Tax=Glossina palpalis gambiensis TaxID=67801 RepID=A0A1B0BG25_9MUSC
MHAQHMKVTKGTNIIKIESNTLKLILAAIFTEFPRFSPSSAARNLLQAFALQMWQISRGASLCRDWQRYVLLREKNVFAIGNEKWELRIGYPLNQPVGKAGLDKKQYSDTIGKGFLIISLYEAHRIISCQVDARRASALLSKMLEVKATLFKAIAITNASSGDGHSLTCI